jgi:hypothetical protein
MSTMSLPTGRVLITWFVADPAAISQQTQRCCVSAQTSQACIFVAPQCRRQIPSHGETSMRDTAADLDRRGKLLPPEERQQLLADLLPL